MEGSGKHFRYIDLNAIRDGLGIEKARALPGFHAFTGCDTVSFFNGQGKKSCMKAWNGFPCVTEAFITLSETTTVTVELECLLEKFVSFLYDAASGLETVKVHLHGSINSRSTFSDFQPPLAPLLSDMNQNR